MVVGFDGAPVGFGIILGFDHPLLLLDEEEEKELVGCFWERECS